MGTHREVHDGGRAGTNLVGNGPDGFFVRTALAATAGGLAAEITGGKFSNGAITAAFAHLFNDEAHRYPESERAIAADAIQPSYFLEDAAMIFAPILRGGMLLLRGVEGATTSLFRAVGHAEFDELAATGAFRAGPGSYETGKWFAESASDAVRWGNVSEGVGKYRVIEVQFPKSAADEFFRLPRLDGIGPARFGTFEQIGRPNIQLLQGPK